MASAPDIIAAPPGMRLKALVRVGDEWHVWIGVHNMSLPYSQWLGTFYVLATDGSVTRVTVRNEGYDDIAPIKPGDRQ